MSETENRPARLWLSAPDEDHEHQVWFDPDEGGTEYVRADLIERQSKALDEAMMVVWWMIGEGIVPADYDIDPDQVMLDNVENITGDSGEYWEAMFESRSLSNKGKGDE